MVTSAAKATVTSATGTANAPSIPLTTPFNPPSSCFNGVFGSALTGTNLGAFIQGPSPVATECYPSGWQPSAAFYFSPGLCPIGYTALSASGIVTSGKTVTHAHCCPDGYALQVGNANVIDNTVCISGPTSFPSRSVTIFSDNPTTTGHNPVGTIAPGTRKGYVYAHQIVVLYASTDSKVLASASSAMSSITNSASPTRKPTAKMGLSPGAKAGIGIAVVIGVILILLALGAFVLVRRRRRTNMMESPGSRLSEIPLRKDIGATNDQGRTEYKAELEDTSNSTSNLKPPALPPKDHASTPDAVELDGTAIGELPADHAQEPHDNSNGSHYQSHSPLRTGR